MAEVNELVMVAKVCATSWRNQVSMVTSSTMNAKMSTKLPREPKKSNSPAITLNRVRRLFVAIPRLELRLPLGGVRFAMDHHPFSSGPTPRPYIVSIYEKNATVYHTFHSGMPHTRIIFFTGSLFASSSMEKAMLVA